MKSVFKAAMILLVLVSFLAMPAVGLSEEYTAGEKAKKEEAKKEKKAKEEKGTVKLEKMVVSTTREMRVLDTPASISVITAKELEEQGVTNVGDAIARIPGVYEVGTNRAYYTMSIRGTRSPSSRGPLVMIDGVPQNIGMTGYNYFGAIPVSDIDRIEILRSPGSTVFGADSAHGVISIITKKGKKDQPLRFKVKASGGSWKTFNEYATLSGGVNKWDYFLIGSRSDTDGYILENRQTATRLKAGYNFSDNTSLGINLGYTDSEFDSLSDTKNLYALNMDRRAADYANVTRRRNIVAQ